MQERRVDPRMLCADLVDVRWKEKGRTQYLVANLEDISTSGAGLQVDSAIPLNVLLEILHPRLFLQGIVRYCIFREIGYFVGVEFEVGNRWSQRDFLPQHMLDPRRLISRTTGKASRSAEDGLIQTSLQ